MELTPYSISLLVMVFAPVMRLLHVLWCYDIHLFFIGFEFGGITPTTIACQRTNATLVGGNVLCYIRNTSQHYLADWDLIVFLTGFMLPSNCNQALCATLCVGFTQPFSACIHRPQALLSIYYIEFVTTLPTLACIRVQTHHT